MGYYGFKLKCELLNAFILNDLLNDTTYAFVRYTVDFTKRAISQLSLRLLTIHATIILTCTVVGQVDGTENRVVKKKLRARSVYKYNGYDGNDTLVYV